MVLIILSILLIIIGILISVLNYIGAIRTEHYETLLIAVGIIGILGFGSIAISVQTSKNVKYENALYTKQVLEYRIENQDKNIVGNELLYNDIVSFNNELRKIKKYSQNPWIGLFFNDKIAEIDYIELEWIDVDYEP